jgi:hypothetical protein
VITAALVVLSAGLLYVALAPTGAYARIELVAGGTVSEGSAS